MEYWEQLHKEWKVYHERMESYESLPEEERLDKYREEIRDAEAKIKGLIGDTKVEFLWKKVKTEDELDALEHYVDLRYYALNKMFAIHCTDQEVRRLEQLNDKLLTLSNQMYARTASFYRHILDMPKEEKDDDIEIEGSLRYWDDGYSTILELEDDAFYGSDFKMMLPVVAYVEREHRGDLAAMDCYARESMDGVHNSSMTDAELDLVNTLDDGKTWADGALWHPKLGHIVFCYAIHALATHNNYCIPDLLRMNDFEVKIEMKLQQFSEQDGSRLWWWTKCSERQFIDKFLHEAEHRPVEKTLGEFIWRRGIEYFDLEDWDECEREGRERAEKYDGTRLKKKTPEELDELYPCNHVSSLPDCRHDDTKVEDFLKALYRTQNEK